MKRRFFSEKLNGSTQCSAVITYNNHSLTCLCLLSVVFSSIIKIEYHKSGQECLEQKLKEIKK